MASGDINYNLLSVVKLTKNVRDLLEGELRNFRFDEEVGVLYRTNEEAEVAFLPFEVRADWVHKWHAGHAHLEWEEIYCQAQARI